MTRSCVIMPLYNDWVSGAMLIRKIDAVVGKWDGPVSVIVVDDGSTEEIVGPAELGQGCTAIADITLIRLVCNQGHQRAIAVGLVHAQKEGYDAVYVMDSDGEDRPEDLETLRGAMAAHPGSVITADRVSRSESHSFRICYKIYQLIFFALIGSRRSVRKFLRHPGNRPEAVGSSPGIVAQHRRLYQKVQTPGEGGADPPGAPPGRGVSDELHLPDAPRPGNHFRIPGGGAGPGSVCFRVTCRGLAGAIAGLAGCGSRPGWGGGLLIAMAGVFFLTAFFSAVSLLGLAEAPGRMVSRAHPPCRAYDRVGGSLLIPRRPGGLRPLKKIFFPSRGMIKCPGFRNHRASCGFFFI